jgi:hypothetical protein
MITIGARSTSNRLGSQTGIAVQAVVPRTRLFKIFRGLSLGAFSAVILAGCGGGGGGGGASTPSNPAPTVSSISPSSATAGGAAFTLTVTGTDFISGSTVDWNGSSRTTTYQSATQLTAAITAADIASSATVPITVVNPTPGGGTSTAVDLPISNALPAVTSISPTTETVGGAAFTLTVNGRGFDSTSVVQWNGSSRTTTLVSSTQVTAAITAADIAASATVPVTVVNPTPGGGTSAAVDLSVNNPVPAVTSISPTSAIVGGLAFTLTVNGSGFDSKSVVQWNGSSRTTTLISATQLTASIAAADVASTGNVTVTVATPTPGGGTSTSITFEVVTTVIANASQIGSLLTKDQLGANLFQSIPDVGQAASVPLFSSARLGLLRWPGGAPSDFYHWQTNTYSTCAPFTPQASFDTWMQNVVQPLGVDVAITINNSSNADCSGPSDPSEAAAWVNYANNTQHYGIKYWTIGNEQYDPPAYGSTALQQTASTYANRVATQFYPLMKAQDPTIQIGIDMAFGNATESVSQDSWDPVVLANATYDFVEIHYYPQYDEQENDTLLLTTYSDQVATNIATVRTLLAANGHANTPIYLGEFDGDAGNATGIGHQTVSVVNALFNAVVVLEAAKAGVPMATTWDGLDNCSPQGSPLSTAYGWQNFGSHGLFAAGGTGFSISCPDQGVPAQTPFPKARAYQILSQFVVPGEHVIGIQSQDSSIRSYAATNSTGYALILINTDSTTTHSPSISISGGASSSFAATTLTYGKQQYDLSQSGTWAAPVAASLGTVATGNFTVALPPWSITLIKLAP